MNKRLRSFLQVVAVMYLGKKVVKLDKEVRDLNDENQKLKDENRKLENERIYADYGRRMKLRDMVSKYGMIDTLVEKNVSAEDLEFFKGLTEE